MSLTQAGNRLQHSKENQRFGADKDWNQENNIFVRPESLGWFMGSQWSALLGVPKGSEGAVAGTLALNRNQPVCCGAFFAGRREQPKVLITDTPAGRTWSVFLD